MDREASGAPSNTSLESWPTQATKSTNKAGNRRHGGTKAAPLGAPQKQPRTALGDVVNNVPVRRSKAPACAVPRGADGRIEAPEYISAATAEDILLQEQLKSPVLNFINDPTDLIPLGSAVSEDKETISQFQLELSDVKKPPSRATSPLVESLFPADALANQFDLMDIGLLDDDDLALA